MPSWPPFWDHARTDHPPIQAPQVHVYETKFPSPAGSDVSFDHGRHAQSFGYRCVDCHHGDSCASCHDTTAHVTRQRPAHQACSACHDTTAACMDCHKAGSK